MAVVSEELLRAIAKVESNGDVNAVGDGGQSIGKYQIKRAYYQDAVEYDSSLKGSGKQYESCKGPGSDEYSKRVIRAYMKRYATPERLGRTPTNEDIARIHNGGPDAWKNESTKGYWEKVRREL